MNSAPRYTKARKHAATCALLLLGLAFSSSPSFSQSPESQSAINGADKSLNYAVVAPVFLSSNGLAADSYIRLFNGKTSSSTFGVTIVGTPSGQTYGSSVDVAIPSFASIQYSLRDLITLTGAGSLTGGDTDFAVYLRNPDPEAGYQHVTYNGVTALFENLSTCTSLVNEQMTSLHKQVVVTNVHTSQLANGGYPSSIYIHNYSNAPITYKLDVYNAGLYSAGVGAVANSGRLICQISNQTVPANSTLTIPFSTIEADSSCVLDSGQLHANVVVSDKSGDVPNASVTHLIRAKTYGGDLGMTAVCAVNRLAGSGS